MPLAPGTLLNNRYRIISILGQGGMGAVYRASDDHLHIPVAVKENLFLTEEYGRQFQREAHILAGLRHVNLPHVTDYFSMENQVQYLVMDYIEGEDLRQRMERMGALPERETILIGISICDALTYLHTRHPPIVHRDIKPGNIKVTADGQAVLVDFGLAKIMQGAQVTSTGARAMTPGYSPPEQYGTARTDPRSDIYSLGATLYATMTGVIPEDGLARMTNKTRLTPIRDLVPKINRKLAETVERALEVDPDDRYQSAEEMKRALIESGELITYFQERPSIAPPPSPLPGSNGEPGILDDGEPAAAAPKSSQRSLSRKQRNRLKWRVISILGVLAAGLVLLFILRPDLPRGMLASFAASPTPGDATRTEIAAAQASPTPPQETNPSETPAPGNIPGAQVDLTFTPSPEPSSTTEPTSSVTFTPTTTPQGGGMGQLAFSSDKTGIMEVWVLDIANPRNQKQITDRRDGACQPSWSPDGMRIVFVSPCREKKETYQGSNLFLINVDAAGNPDRASVTQITFSLEGDFEPTWSPDGKRIAFTSLINGRPSINVISLDDMSITELSQSRFPDRHPAWSPSGMQLAYVRQEMNSQIWIMADNGSFQSRFTFSGPVNNLWPAWSVDGNTLFYSQTGSGPDSSVPVLFYRRYEDRKNPVENRVPVDSTSGPIAEVNPSPDGFWLAYESWPQGTNHDIYIMNVNGSNLTRLTTDPGFDFGPVWRPIQTLAQP